MKFLPTMLCSALAVGALRAMGAPQEPPAPAAPVQDQAVPVAAPAQGTTEHFVSVSKNIALRGLVHVRYLNFQDTALVDGFDIRRARLEFKGDVAPHVGYRLQVEMAGIARLLDATVSYTVDDRLVFTAGQAKTPYCYDNTYNPWTLRTISRTQLDEALSGRARDLYGDQQGRDIGVRASGKFATKGKRPLAEYAVGLYNGAGINRADNNDDKDVGAALRLSPMKDLWISARYYNGMGRPGPLLVGPSLHRVRQGLDASWAHGRILVEGEYLQGTDGDLDRSGYYATLGWAALKDRLRVLARLDQYDPDLSASQNAMTRYVGAAEWRFNENTRIMVEYDLMDEEGDAIANDIIGIQFQAAF